MLAGVGSSGGKEDISGRVFVTDTDGSKVFWMTGILRRTYCVDCQHTAVCEIAFKPDFADGDSDREVGVGEDSVKTKVMTTERIDIKLVML